MIEPIVANAEKLSSEILSLKEPLETTVRESPIESQNELIRNNSLESLTAQVEEMCAGQIIESSHYSETVTKSIRTPEELNLYTGWDLKESVVGDKTALTSKEINPDQLDGMGRTNKERVERGMAPLDSNGESYNLHHIGQSKDSPLA